MLPIALFLLQALPTPTPLADPVFVDVAAAVGLPTVVTTGSTFPSVFDDQVYMQRNMGCGAAVGDYDGDGDDDVYLLAYLGHANRLLRNDVDSQGVRFFTDRTVEAGVGDLGLSRTAAFCDLDNDGDQDLVLLNDTDGPVNGTSKLYENQGDGTFVDVTGGSGFHPFGFIRTCVSIADYDMDGLADLYLSNWGFELGTGSADFPGQNLLYRNLGGMQFQDVTQSAGLGTLDRDSFTSIFTDFDGDLRPDLFVAIDHSSDEYFKNTPTGFVQVTSQVGVTHTGNDMGLACADFDDDGDLDVFATNVTGPDFGTTQGNCFSVNQLSETGVHSFVDEASQRGVLDSYWGWGTDWVDFEHDGDLDLVSVSGYDDFISFQSGGKHELIGTPSLAFLNDSGTFQRTIPTAFNEHEDSRALIAFDYDKDGDQDLLITQVAGPPILMENRTPQMGNWLIVRPRQNVYGNRDGFGATLRWVDAGGNVKRRELIGGKSYLAGSPAEIHLGLRTTPVVEELRITWTDGSETVLSGLLPNRYLTIRQRPADVNEDGTVDIDDLLLLVVSLADCTFEDCRYDVDYDGELGLGDVIAILADFD